MSLSPTDSLFGQDPNAPTIDLDDIPLDSFEAASKDTFGCFDSDKISEAAPQAANEVDLSLVDESNDQDPHLEVRSEVAPMAQEYPSIPRLAAFMPSSDERGLLLQPDSQFLDPRLLGSSATASATTVPGMGVGTHQPASWLYASPPQPSAYSFTLPPQLPPADPVQAAPAPQPVGNSLPEGARIGGSRNKKSDYDPKDVYTPVPQAPSWVPAGSAGNPRQATYGKRVIQYAEGGELHWSVLFDKESFLEYALGLPGQGRRLRLWVQNTPTQHNKRFLRNGSAHRCRMAKCPKVQIMRGFYQVAIDEHADESGLGYDPFHVAGYFHLWCLETALEPDALTKLAELGVDMQPDIRDLKFEQRNPMSLNRDGLNRELLHTYHRWFTERRNKPRSPLRTPERDGELMLCRALTAQHLENQSPARQSARAKRNGFDISRHKGDLGYAVRYRQALKLHERRMREKARQAAAPPQATSTRTRSQTNGRQRTSGGLNGEPIPHRPMPQRGAIPGILQPMASPAMDPAFALPPEFLLPSFDFNQHGGTSLLHSQSPTSAVLGYQEPFGQYRPRTTAERTGGLPSIGLLSMQPSPSPHQNTLSQGGSWSDAVVMPDFLSDINDIDIERLLGGSNDSNGQSSTTQQERRRRSSTCTLALESEGETEVRCRRVTRSMSRQLDVEGAGASWARAESESPGRKRDWAAAFESDVVRREHLKELQVLTDAQGRIKKGRFCSI